MSSTPRRELIMLVPRTEAPLLNIINTSAIECKNADTPLQSAAFYLSALAGLFPGLLPLAKEDFREIGYTVTEVTEHTAPEYGITFQRPIPFHTTLAIFAQFALIIYKNLDDRSYVQFIQRRTAAVKRIVGKFGDLVPGEGDILLPISTAKNIRTIVGSSTKIRAGLLRVILANENGESLLNGVCSYLAEIISWTEMANSPVKLVYESLCEYDSPVLKDMRVEREVMYLNRIVEEYPQYYRILHPNEAIVRSRFKTLAEVAMRYKEEVENPDRKTAASSNGENTLVNDLLSMHHAHMKRIHMDAVRALTAFDFDDLITFG